MGRYVSRRLLNYVILLFVAVSLTYFLAASQLNPRSLYLIVNPPIDPESIEQALLSRNLSDNVPLLERYRIWLGDIVTSWDWGDSPKGGPVQEEIGRRMWVSLRLITIGSVVGTVIGVVLGAWSATRQYKVSDRTLTFGSLFILSVPAVRDRQRHSGDGHQCQQRHRACSIFEFVGETGTQGDYFGAGLLDRMQHLLLPTLVLILINAAFFSRIQRNLMLDALGSDFVRTARAKGLRQSHAVMKHALRTS